MERSPEFGSRQECSPYKLKLYPFRIPVQRGPADCLPKRVLGAQAEETASALQIDLTMNTSTVRPRRLSQFTRFIRLLLHWLVCFFYYKC